MNTSTASPTTATVAATTPAAASANATAKGLAILRRADHGTVEVKVKGVATGTATGTAAAATATWQTFTFDRGKVTTVTADQITLARPDGVSVTLTITPTTKYRGVTSWSEITTAKRATVVSQNGTATIIAQRVAPTGTGGTTSSTTAPPAA